ncbi:DRTGG domain-containing protein [Chloroflexota bacterium]
MVTLYVVSAERATGKTAICAGVGKSLLGGGKKAGFMKLAASSNDDATFMRQVLSLSESVESLSPSGDAGKVKEAYNRVSQGKDVVIIEGMVGPTPDDSLSKASYEIAKVLDARVLVVAGYGPEASRFINSYQGFGKSLLGVVLNKVPQSQLKRVQGEASAQFGEAGIGVLGVLPEDRDLFTLTVGELADSIQGKILNSAEKSKELVTDIMLGAMVVDSGLEYFGRQANKAAIVRSDRPDMQMAALETSARCLVINGGTASPIHSVLYKAENKGVPIILTESNTEDVVTGIEVALGKARFNQEKKLPKLAEIMQQHLDFQAIHKGLGLAG